ncbi:YjeF family domain-containing protein [Pneumocystis carinii B80]|uniref:NAD(P)H-hydrate epimerase n=1 Tax=Pneumocystis carinii (strain B80) TaxID=1408658 RepID=A0A0W4ZH70_PNEC8|nr:YjeF family domain-containing protein [Pneumocystis carinii B80]KTW27728.1 YjeF family domain-containing protein [Pneumocystis carinii B80]
MVIKSLNRDQSSSVDEESFLKGFSIDQLMELSGLSVSQVIYDVHPLEKGSRILVLAGPGNNGGDGLVAARHLWHYGYILSVYYPKKGKKELFERLCCQLNELSIPFVNDISLAMKETDHIIDAIFGFNFSGEVREPFIEVIEMLKHTKIPITSIDIPSGWDIEKNPFENEGTDQWNPTFLVSLTAPKPCSQYFKGRHFIGGRFITPSIMKKYKLSPIKYDGYKQYAEITGIPIENDFK